MSDILEQAIKAADINYPGAHVEIHNSGKDKSQHANHRHPACGFCGAFNTLKSKTVRDNGKNSTVYYCSSCDKEMPRYVTVKNRGPSVSQTRPKNIRDIGDSFIPNMRAFERLSREAVGWLRWAHTSQPRGDKGKAAALFAQVRWWAYLKVAESVEVGAKDNTHDIFIKTFTLVEMLIHGRQSGRVLPSTRELARAINLDHSQLSGARKWALVVSRIHGVFDEWEAEIIDVMGEGR